MKTGILLLNLGTPQAPTWRAVWRYLNEFLSDPRVITLPAVVRLPLVWGVIAPFRMRQSARAYQQIWNTLGSPLLMHSLMQQTRLQEALGANIPVALGMRYGEPSIARAIESLLAKGVQHIKILPLYPQYASASSGSAIEKTLDVLKKLPVVPSFELLPAFYNHPLFIQALAQTAVEASEAFQPDFLLMSFHGLPVNHVVQADAPGFQCDREAPCPDIQTDNQNCYRAQCYATARALAQALRLGEDEFAVSFQSRLGKTPWIAPHTNEILSQLRAKGIKRLAVICPAFVADCLETLEEIGIRLKTEWLRQGGETFLLIPCVNAHPAFIRFLSQQLNTKTPTKTHATQLEAMLG